MIIVIVPYIGNTNRFATPTSIPPFATTKSNSPPEEQRPTAVRTEVNLLILCNLAERNTVINFAPVKTAINTNTDTMNRGIKLKFINAPTETKNSAAKISLTGVASTVVTAWDFDSAINTHEKKAPAATEIPSLKEIKTRAKATPTTATIKTTCWLVLAIASINLGIVREPITTSTPTINASVIPIDKIISVIETFPLEPTDWKMASKERIN